MRRTVIRIIAGSISIAAWIFVGFSLAGGLAPHLDSRPYEASGRVVAGQALALLASGGEITVIARDTSTFMNPATDIQLASFRRAIGQANATIRSVHPVQVDPLRAVQVPSGDFCEIIGHTGKGSVIVSFMGPPLLNPAERARLGEIKPAIVAFCSGRMPESADFRSLFDQGLLRAAVVDRRDAEWNEQSLLTLTATDLAGVSARGGLK